MQATHSTFKSRRTAYERWWYGQQLAEIRFRNKHRKEVMGWIWTVVFTVGFLTYMYGLRLLQDYVALHGI